MNNKILISSLFVLTLLLVMPSLPALHNNKFENNIKQGINEVTHYTIFDFKPPDKFPLAFYFVLAIGYFRAFRLYMLIKYSIKEGEFPGTFEIVHPLIAIRCIILLWTTDWWLEGWDSISDYFGWGWFERR